MNAINGICSFWNLDHMSTISTKKIIKAVLIHNRTVRMWNNEGWILYVSGKSSDYQMQWGNMWWVGGGGLFW